MRKVFVKATVELTLDMEDGVTVENAMSGLNVTTDEWGVEVTNHTVQNYTVEDFQ
jgi:hypothetical protein